MRASNIIKYSHHSKNILESNALHIIKYVEILTKFINCFFYFNVETIWNHWIFLKDSYSDNCNNEFALGYNI